MLRRLYAKMSSSCGEDDEYPDDDDDDGVDKDDGALKGFLGEFVEAIWFRPFPHPSSPPICYLFFEQKKNNDNR